MAKGNLCPNCGEQTFHRGKGAMSCSSCGTIGWLSAPDSVGSGRGAKCRFCGRMMVKTVGTVSTVRVRYCYNCGATFLQGP
jgi:DNA-directed RNA polymerase subunit RPC12/RpoP